MWMAYRQILVSIGLPGPESSHRYIPVDSHCNNGMRKCSFYLDGIVPAIGAMFGTLAHKHPLCVLLLSYFTLWPGQPMVQYISEKDWSRKDIV